MDQKKAAKSSEVKASEPSVLTKLQTAADKSREAFDGAMLDFRNRFTVGHTSFEDDDN